jgi:hypothetical protein
MGTATNDMIAIARNTQPKNVKIVRAIGNARVKLKIDRDAMLP